MEPCHNNSREITVKFLGIWGTSCCHIEIDHDGNIYTVEIKYYKSGLPTLPGENHLSDIYQQSTRN